MSIERPLRAYIQTCVRARVAYLSLLYLSAHQESVYLPRVCMHQGGHERPGVICECCLHKFRNLYSIIFQERGDRILHNFRSNSFLRHQRGRYVELPSYRQPWSGRHMILRAQQSALRHWVLPVHSSGYNRPQ